MDEMGKNSTPEDVTAETVAKSAENEANEKEETLSADQVEELENEVENDLLVQLKKREEQYASLHDTYLRLMAEFDNFRKRTAREKSALMEYASEKVITELLPVLDDFSRTLTVIEKTDNLSSIQEGIRMVSDRLFRILEKEGLKPIESIGQPFDANLHEAITSVPAEAEQKGKVIDEAGKGYRLKDKVIRYSKVIVGE